MLPVTFGLGSVEQVERLVIRWPGGGETLLEGLDANHAYRVHQEKGVIRRVPIRR